MVRCRPVDGHGDNVALVMDAPLTEGSVEDTENPHLALVIDVAGLRVVDAARSTAQRQALLERVIGLDGLHGVRYTRVTYHSLSIEQPGQGVWLIRGELELWSAGGEVNMACWYCYSMSA